MRATERAAAVPLGLCCDAIYSVCFLSSALMWIARGKSILAGGSSRAEAAQRPSP